MKHTIFYKNIAKTVVILWYVEDRIANFESIDHILCLTAVQWLPTAMAHVHFTKVPGYNNMSDGQTHACRYNHSGNFFFISQDSEK